MPKSFFRFQQFTVHHDKSAMKVGTDAVLLGAWADITGAKKILDIGTGSGVIALMLAQRSNAFIDAIDIDEKSCLQAKENFNASPWYERLNVKNISLKEFTSPPAPRRGEFPNTLAIQQPECMEFPHSGGGGAFTANNIAKYDIVVSNPPYFTDAFKPVNKRRYSARHNELLPLTELAECSAKLLNKNGKFCVILPLKEAAILVSLSENQELYPEKITTLFPAPGKEAIRKLIMFSHEKNPIQFDEIKIELDGKQNYSAEYKNLTKDYYLAF